MMLYLRDYDLQNPHAGFVRDLLNFMKNCITPEHIKVWSTSTHWDDGLKNIWYIPTSIEFFNTTARNLFLTAYGEYYTDESYCTRQMRLQAEEKSSV